MSPVPPSWAQASWPQETFPELKEWGGARPRHKTTASNFGPTGCQILLEFSPSFPRTPICLLVTIIGTGLCI